MSKISKHTSFFWVSVLLLSLFSCSPKGTGFFQQTSGTQQAVKSESSGGALYARENGQDGSSSAGDVTPEIIPFQEASLPVIREATPSEPVAEKGALTLTKEQKKEIRKDIKETIKQAKKSETEVNTLLLVIIAILLPPVAVALVDGITGPFWLSILLTLLFYLPGLIYALYRIFRKR